MFKATRAGFEKVAIRTLQEAKQAEFNFRVHDGEDERIIPSCDVELGKDGLKYSFDRADYVLRYSKFSVQVLVGAKVVNIIRRPNIRLWLIMIMLPLFVGFLLMQFKSAISATFGFEEEFIFGFSVAVIFVGYGSQIGGSLYIGRMAQQREVRAVSSSSQLITKLERASDVEDYFSRLIQVNLSNMEHFYTLVRVQTEKSYGLTQAASVVGFFLLVSGIILSFVEGINKSAVGVTVAVGALVQFISAVFFYIYNKTVNQLNTYHERLVNVQDTMLALKVAQIVKDEKTKDDTMAYLTKALTRRFGENQALPAQQVAQAGSPASGGPIA